MLNLKKSDLMAIFNYITDIRVCEESSHLPPLAVIPHSYGLNRHALVLLTAGQKLN